MTIHDTQCSRKKKGVCRIICLYNRRKSSIKNHGHRKNIIISRRVNTKRTVICLYPLANPTKFCETCRGTLMVLTVFLIEV